MANVHKRKHPDEVLEQIRREERGRLKLFIGAAPGAGKTYTMLREGNELLQKGCDLVIGFVETHGREETRKQIGALPLLPLKEIEYKGRVLQELDLQAILDRRPHTVIVDELAHTNVPGSKHRKRYEDVEELLQAGIHVLAAMNIQHVESLNDTVERLTGVKVRERVPDRVLNRAHEIQLIDTPPEQLRERMRNGLIYRPDKIEQALKHFFRLGNLNVLRELALREIADDVEERLQHYQQEHGIEGMTGAHEKILVCVQYRPNAERLIRRGWRIANRLKCDLHILNVSVRPLPELAAQERKKLQVMEQLARDLGAVFHFCPTEGKKPVDVMVSFIKRHRITQVILGQSARTRWEEISKGSIINKIMKDTQFVDVLVVADGVENRD
ncbi:two-component system sensor histidine kinase KdpD [Tumebacillus sp. BK434]|uniref:universal stress protein n=1 Tax=Tumebacillus sp. BK434 TaxID=2512169 RepID=UPI001049FAA6|nr:universal stress protein [Tumebacillus sp. BK434]TCP58153.1 two-component system sensor histidine kinase KdpD [Tumebacillus sp. BK434]